MGAKLLLRIDDSDSERCRDEYLEDIFRSLEQLKIDISHGPSGVDDFKKNFSQIPRLKEYRAQAEKLYHAGKAF